MNDVRRLIGAVATAVLAMGILAGATVGTLAEPKQQGRPAVMAKPNNERPADPDCCVAPMTVAEQKKQ
jgi:hypothetical protein